MLKKKPAEAEVLVFYVSKALKDVEVHYSDIKKLIVALVISAKCLRLYFLAHTIHAYTNKPLWQVFQKLETSGRLIKGTIELGEFDIHFRPIQAEKGQAIANFISQFTEPVLSTTFEPTIKLAP